MSLVWQSEAGVCSQHYSLHFVFLWSFHLNCESQLAQTIHSLLAFLFFNILRISIVCSFFFPIFSIWSIHFFLILLSLIFTTPFSLSLLSCQVLSEDSTCLLYSAISDFSRSFWFLLFCSYLMTVLTFNFVPLLTFSSSILL